MSSVTVQENTTRVTTVMWLILAVWFAAVAMAYSIFVSACALTVEEMMFRRYPRWTDLQRSFFAAIYEVFGYRQLNAWWGCVGTAQAIARTRGWGR